MEPSAADANREAGRSLGRHIIANRASVGHSEAMAAELLPLSTHRESPPDEVLARAEAFRAEVAPSLIVIFGRPDAVNPSGTRSKNYDVQKSFGIATGILSTELHRAGIATLTHTPPPIGFLHELLGRLKNKCGYLVLVTGYPAADGSVTRITKKSLSDVATFI
jgi:hypothetical protein